MKASLWLRLPAMGLALWTTLAICADAGDEFKIVGLRPFWSNDLIQVGKAWRKDSPKRIQASLRVEADTPASAIFVKAYFYDKDEKLVGTDPAPNKIWMATSHGIEEVGLPVTLAHSKTIDVYFAIPDDPQAKNWTTVVVVFGNAAKVAASANPATELAKVDFPEKARLSSKPE